MKNTIDKYTETFQSEEIQNALKIQKEIDDYMKHDKKWFEKYMTRRPKKRKR